MAGVGDKSPEGLLIAILDAHAAGGSLTPFLHAYGLCLALALASGLVSLALGRNAATA